MTIELLFDGYLLLVNPCNSELIAESTKLNKSAHQKPFTVKPSTRLSANIIKKVLITKVNKPRVKMFTGKVKSKINGFKSALIKPNTIDRIKAATNPEMLTPGSNIAVR